jgi:hypothetical protein
MSLILPIRMREWSRDHRWGAYAVNAAVNLAILVTVRTLMPLLPRPFGTVLVVLTAALLLGLGLFLTVVRIRSTASRADPRYVSAPLLTVLGAAILFFSFLQFIPE